MEYINGTTRFEKFKFLAALGGVLSFNGFCNLFKGGRGGGGMLRDFFSMKSTKSNQMRSLL